MSPQGAYAIRICYAMSTSDDERIPLSYVPNLLSPHSILFCAHISIVFFPPSV